MNKKFLAFWALCSIIFLDGVGLGIIFPLLVPLIWDPHLSVLPESTTMVWRNIFYGVTLSVFPFGMFFSAPILGDLSDGLGRKKVLVFAVTGVGIAYFLTGFSVVLHSLSLLIFSRFMAGLLSGCQPIAQAAAMDISADDEKSKHLSLIFLFSSLGFMVGPMLGSSLSNNVLVSWFSLSTPMFVAAFFSFACVFLLKNFQETLTEKRVVDLQPLRGLYVLREVWQAKSVRVLLLILLCYQLAWSGFFQVVPAFAAQKYHFTTQLNGYFSSSIAIGFGAAFLGCIAYLEKRFGPQRVVTVAFLVANLCLLTVLVWHHPLALWLTGAPLGFCVATI